MFKQIIFLLTYLLKLIPNNSVLKISALFFGYTANFGDPMCAGR